MTEAARIFPTFRYRDAERMAAWLKEAFGFTEHAIHRDDQGRIVHAELAFGGSIIMFGPVRQDAYGAMVGEPGQQGGKSLYIAVEDVDALYARARSAGARIEEEPTDQDYGSRQFICRDPEDNLWCFGTYWPKAGSHA